MTYNKLRPEDYDHPIFMSSSLDEFVEHWWQLNSNYSPSSESQSFRILATIQHAKLVTVNCGDIGKNAAVYDVRFENGEAFVQVSIPGEVGIYNPIQSQLTLVEIKRP